MGPRASGSFYSSPRGAPSPSGARTLCSSLCLGPSLRVPLFWLNRPTKVLPSGIYLLRRADTAVAFYKVSRDTTTKPRRRESCTAAWRYAHDGVASDRGYTYPALFSFTDLFSLVLGLSFVSQFPITRLRMIYAILYFTC